MKRLITQASLYKAIKIDDNYIEVFKNPTSKEIRDCFTQSSYNTARILITEDDCDVYAWRGDYDHNDLKSITETVNEYGGLQMILYANGNLDISVFNEMDAKSISYYFENASSNLKNIGITNNSPVELVPIGRFTVNNSWMDDIKTVADLFKEI